MQNFYPLHRYTTISFFVQGLDQSSVNKIARFVGAINLTTNCSVVAGAASGTSFTAIVAGNAFKFAEELSTVVEIRGGTAKDFDVKYHGNLQDYFSNVRAETDEAKRIATAERRLAPWLATVADVTYTV